ncbi:hypothetical protein QTP86_004861 [Hemibagrus guttatus]|nr:hypothetical protein QTP86_004861 [Hemibagrus guttatus]
MAVPLGETEGAAKTKGVSQKGWYIKQVHKALLEPKQIDLHDLGCGEGLQKKKLERKEVAGTIPDSADNTDCCEDEVWEEVKFWQIFLPLQLDPGLPDREASVTMHSSNHIVKFANDMTKEMAVDIRRAQSDHSPLFIKGSPVEIVKSTKLLGVYLVENFTWSLSTTSITKKAWQCHYFLRRLRKAHLPPPILTIFYRGTIESILSSWITAWFGNCTVSDRKTLQRIVRTAEKIIGVSLPSIMDMYTTRCIRKANSIVDDPTHPSHTLFTLLPSGKSDTVSKPYSMASLTTVLYTFPLILADIFLSHRTLDTFLHPFQPACTRFFTSFPHSPLNITLNC